MAVEEDSYTPGLLDYPNYPSTWTFVLAGVHIAVGVVIMALSVVHMSGVTGVPLGMLVHLGFSFFLIVTGMVGIAAGKLKTAKPIVYFLLMSGMASLFAIYGFFAFVAVAIRVGRMRPGDSNYESSIIAEVFVFLVSYLVTAVSCGWSAGLTFRAIICGHDPSPEVAVVYQHAQY